jgi:DNA-binding Lrp family transcriptional regulator
MSTARTGLPVVIHPAAMRISNLRFVTKIFYCPKSRRVHLNTSATSLLKRVRELQHSRFVKRRTKDLQPYG